MNGSGFVWSRGGRLTPPERVSVEPPEAKSSSSSRLRHCSSGVSALGEEEETIAAAETAGAVSSRGGRQVCSQEAQSRKSRPPRKNSKGLPPVSSTRGCPILPVP